MSMSGRQRKKIGSTVSIEYPDRATDSDRVVKRGLGKSVMFLCSRDGEWLT